LTTVQVIVTVPGLAAVRVAETVMEFVPAPAVIVAVVPVPPNVQVNVPDWAGTLAVKFTPAVAVEFGGGVTIAFGDG